MVIKKYQPVLSKQMPFSNPFVIMIMRKRGLTLFRKFMRGLRWFVLNYVRTILFK